MKVLVISGFLGAGKTTFIKQMMKSTKREYVILENEFGDVSVDGDILKNDTKDNDEDVNIFEVSSGCACCSTKGDFLSTLLTIDNTLNPDFLIVEPSGIAVLSNIIKNINKLQYDRIEILAPITIVDVNTYFKYKDKYAEIFMDQVEVCSHIQLSKQDDVSNEEVQKIVEDIRKINNTAKIYSEKYEIQGEDYWNGIFSGELKKFNSDKLKEVMNKMQNITFKDAHIRDVNALVFWLDKLVKGYYGEVNRAKGIFKSVDYNLQFDVVDKKYNITFAQGEAENNVIVIGPLLDKELLLKEFEMLKNEK